MLADLEVSTPVGTCDYAIAAADLNRDGRLDLVVGANCENTDSILITKPIGDNH